MSQRNQKKRGNIPDYAIRVGISAVILAAVLLVLLGLLFSMNHNEKAGNETADATVAASQAESEQMQQTAVAEVTAAPTPEVTPEPTPEPVPQPVAPEAEDGSGQAGLMPMDASINTLAYQDGWFLGSMNSWFSPDMVNCYYNGWQEINGQLYHFDVHGMIDRGWKYIGGQSCYFDGSGVYHPEADPNKLLAFTFDDGPSEGTSELLDLCEQTGARISFFLVGNMTPEYPGVIERIVQDRCLLGSHSLDHTQMIKISTEECVANFQQSDALIRENGGGAETEVYRFPYGDYTPEELAAVGKPGIMWSLDSLDWDYKNTDMVINKVLTEVEEGDIILMHDLYETTIEACRYLFPYLISQGYQLVTVKELAAAKGFELEPGKTYYGFCQEYIEENRVWE